MIERGNSLKEVIVFGAAGTIGNVIVRELVESGVEVIGADMDINRLQLNWNYYVAGKKSGRLMH